MNGVVNRRPDYVGRFIHRLKGLLIVAEVRQPGAIAYQVNEAHAVYGFDGFIFARLFRSTAMQTAYDSAVRSIKNHPDIARESVTPYGRFDGEIAATLTDVSDPEKAARMVATHAGVSVARVHNNRVHFNAAIIKKISGKIRIEVTTPQQYRDAKYHAAKLGLQVENREVLGEWEHITDGMVHAVTHDHRANVAEVGKEHFYIEVDSVMKCKSVGRGRRAGRVEVTFA